MLSYDDDLHYQITYIIISYSILGQASSQPQPLMPVIPRYSETEKASLKGSKVSCSRTRSSYAVPPWL